MRRSNIVRRSSRPGRNTVLTLEMFDTLESLDSEFRNVEDFEDTKRSNKRGEAANDADESTTPFLRYMPRESYNETGEPRPLDFSGDRRRFDI